MYKIVIFILGLIAIVALTLFLAAPEKEARLLSDPATEKLSGDNARIRFLTGEPDVADQWPRFSPDGKYVLFTRGNPFDIAPMLYVVPTDGGEARPLTSPELGVTPAAAVWSPRGDRIVFVGIAKQNKKSLWLIDPDGSNPRQLELEAISDRVAYPSWYPDGERLAVLDHNVIKRIDLNDGSVVEITDLEQVFAGKPSVSPDGQWIAFAGQKNTGQDYDKFSNTLWLISSSGDPQTLRHLLDQGRHPNWSPDGRQLTFDIAHGKSTAVHVINVDGSGLRQVTDYALKAQNPDWSPDGTKLVAAAQPEVTAGQFDAPGLVIIDLDL